MRITKVAPAPGCLDSVRAFELSLDPTLDRGEVLRLAVDSSLDLHEGFARPYFKIVRSRTWVLQGVLGSPRLRVTLLPDAPDTEIEVLRGLIEGLS